MCRSNIRKPIRRDNATPTTMLEQESDPERHQSGVGGLEGPVAPRQQPDGVGSELGNHLHLRVLRQELDLSTRQHQLRLRLCTAHLGFFASCPTRSFSCIELSAENHFASIQLDPPQARPSCSFKCQEKSHCFGLDCWQTSSTERCRTRGVDL